MGCICSKSEESESEHQTRSGEQAQVVAEMRDSHYERENRRNKREKAIHQLQQEKSELYDRSEEQAQVADEMQESQYERENDRRKKREKAIKQLPQKKEELYDRSEEQVQVAVEMQGSQYESENNKQREKEKAINQPQQEKSELYDRSEEQAQVADEMQGSQYERENDKRKEREKAINQLPQKKRELYNRALAGRKLADNNPNIAGLSDVNRPTKLAEKYCQLYDNEWADAFEELKSLQEYELDGEKKIIKVLFDTIAIAYQLALERATLEIEMLKEAIHDVEGIGVENNDLINQFKYLRKRENISPDNDLLKKYESKVKEQFPEMPSDKPNWIKYRDSCINITWLMSIQDPPMYLECDDEVCKSGDKYDQSRYREYTKSGDLIDYPVWPALYIHRGGLMLEKGVVQCITDE